MRFILHVEEGYNLCSYEKIKGDMSCIQLCPTDAIMIVKEQELLSLIKEGRSIQVLKRTFSRD
jgi:Na+-translocating ferredoxin:NAD+ oxidoreductase RNF subunit RnfB